MRHLLGCLSSHPPKVYSHILTSFSWKRQAVRSASSKHYGEEMHDHSTVQYHGWFCLPDRASQCTYHHLLYVQVQLHKIARRSQLLMRMNRLEVEDLTPAPSMTVPLEHSSRPTLGFPLGTALLLLVIFSLSGLFSCCYHWDRLRSLLRSRHPAMFQEGEHTVISIAPSPSKAASDQKVEKVGKECGLPVIMPGDKVPKFFARPCPRETCLPEAEGKSSEVPSGANKCSVQENVSICIHESSTVSC
ncbi:hypothetical protein U9M48_011206 [Paspalum notatum var. saurae]|uniref:Uncharacterized protein n=1 Tax=Paspalum notatum var. saurae TaxID=547442 RepID=A0AAQ3SUY0_PASNO